MPLWPENPRRDRSVGELRPFNQERRGRLPSRLSVLPSRSKAEWSLWRGNRSVEEVVNWQDNRTPGSAIRGTAAAQ